MQKKLKVALFTSHYGDACEYIRITAPMNLIQADFSVFREKDEISSNLIEKSDLIIVQRNFPGLEEKFAQVCRFSRKNNVPLIFEIDDYLFDLPESHPDRISRAYTSQLLPMLNAIIEADVVTVPTEVLKRKLDPFNSKVVVLSNYLDDRIWLDDGPIVKPGSEYITIGYQASYTHQPDFEEIVPVVNRLIETYPKEIRFKIWGIPTVESLSGLPNVEFLPAFSSDYREFVEKIKLEKIDIGIAPLKVNEFNRAKSAIKYLEYGANHIPAVYANTGQYVGVVTEGKTGFLAESTEDWIEKLSKLIEGPELRAEMGRLAFEDVCANWLLSKHRKLLISFYHSIAELGKGNKQKNIELLTAVNSQVSQALEFSRDENNKLEQNYHKMSAQFYELQRKVEELESRLEELNLFNQEKTEQLTHLDVESRKMKNLLEEKSWELNEIKISKTWKVASLLRKLRMKLAPPDSRQAMMGRKIYYFLVGKKRRWITKPTLSQGQHQLSDLRKINFSNSLPLHKGNVDIIVCIHNALDDVKRCLDSILENTTKPYRLILVDDGSDSQTAEFLAQFVKTEPGTLLLRNDTAKGYTFAANMGMRASNGTYVVLLNSDTVVSPQWLDRMVRACQLDDSIAVVGPLSNTASWQSIPKLSEDGDWAENRLPEGLTVEKMSKLVAKYSGYLYPEVPLLNGFCLLIRKNAIRAVGLFDEETFGQGYGEEDDFNLRVGYAGLKKVIADDTYVYHAQSKSYSPEKRKQLSAISGERLKKKHGLETIERAVAQMYPSRLFEGIRSRMKVMIERESLLEEGKSYFTGKRALFVLPVMDAGGGANVILDEAFCMKSMGVEVAVFNLSEYQDGFLQSYKHCKVPFVFDKIENLEKIANDYDAVIASAHYSVPWLKPLEKMQSRLKLGYYIQGFEALMYPEGSEDSRIATASYQLIEGMVGFTKTVWTKKQIEKYAFTSPEVIGVSVNIDLFRPRINRPLATKPIHIAAMIRPSSPYRNPEFTAKLLKETKKKFGSDVDITLFGADDLRDVLHPQLLDFDYRAVGKLTQIQVAELMSDLDIFTDFSLHQAMGLSALEAMASGACVLVPKNGGAIEFVSDHENGLVVDTTDFQACKDALFNLIENGELRKRLQIDSINSVSKLYPEKCAFNILKLLFQ